MIPGSDPEKPVGFVNNVGPTVNGANGSNGMGVLNIPSHSVTPHGTTGGGGARSVEGLPSYSQILSSDDSLKHKASALYTGTVARVQYQFASVKPWSEFFDRDFFSAPQGTSDVVNRLNRNISHFYSNYVILSLVCSSYVLLINPVFSIGVVLLALMYLYVRARAAAMAEDEASDGMVYLFNKGFTPMQLYLFLLVFGVVMFYLTSGSSVIFWLVFTSLGVTCGHAAMRRPPLEEHTAFQLA